MWTQSARSRARRKISNLTFCCSALGFASTISRSRGNAESRPSCSKKRRMNAWWLTPAVGSDLVLGDSTMSATRTCVSPDRVADADDVGAWKCFVDRPRDHGHRVGVVEQPRVGTAAASPPRSPEHHRDGTQRPRKMPPMPRVSAIVCRTPCRCGISKSSRVALSPDIDLVHDVVRAVEARPPSSAVATTTASGADTAAVAWRCGRTCRAAPDRCRAAPGGRPPAAETSRGRHTRAASTRRCRTRSPDRRNRSWPEAHATAVPPPSITSVAPATKDASSEARNA